MKKSLMSTALEIIINNELLQNKDAVLNMGKVKKSDSGDSGDEITFSAHLTGNVWIWVGQQMSGFLH